MTKPPAPPKPVALRIELQKVKPLVWRRVLVSSHWTLASLHHYLQWVMGWADRHMHEFRVGDGVVAPEWWIAEVAQGSDTRQWRDERRVSVAALLAELGEHGDFQYHYDMGDGWCHRVVFDSLPPSPAFLKLPLPLCLAGENACPPEDVGGPWGYMEFVNILADPKHREHAERMRWIGGVFDPAGFDLNRINRDFKGAKTRRR
jgi:hypothetical protein